MFSIEVCSVLIATAIWQLCAMVCGFMIGGSFFLYRLRKVFILSCLKRLRGWVKVHTAVYAATFGEWKMPEAFALAYGLVLCATVATQGLAFK